MAYRKIPVTFILLDKDLRTPEPYASSTLQTCGAIAVCVILAAVPAVVAINAWRTPAAVRTRASTPAVGWCYSTVDPGYCQPPAPSPSKP
jgi:hypothetical protein